MAVLLSEAEGGAPEPEPAKGDRVTVLVNDAEIEGQVVETGVDAGNNKMVRVKFDNDEAKWFDASTVTPDK